MGHDPESEKEQQVPVEVEFLEFLSSITHGAGRNL